MKTINFRDRLLLKIVWAVQEKNKVTGQWEDTAMDLSTRKAARGELKYFREIYPNYLFRICRRTIIDRPVR